MVKPFSWLYGASQGPECRFCGDMVYPLATTLRSHEFWCDAKSRPTWTLPQSRVVGTDEARGILERAALQNRAVLNRLAR